MVAEGMAGFSLNYPANDISKHVRLDGKETAGTGKNLPAGYLSSGKRVGARKVEVTDTLQGKVLDTAEIEVAKNGKTLTMTQHVAGHDRPDVLVFERVE